MTKIILVDEDRRNRAVEAVKGAPIGMTVTIKPGKRSLSQNDCFHALCAEYASLKGEEPEVIKNAMKYFAFGIIESEVEGEVLRELKKSSSCDKAEMSHLIETTHRKAAEDGFNLTVQE